MICSCSSMEQAETSHSCMSNAFLKEKVINTNIKWNKEITLVPKYVFLDDDGRSLFIKEDFTSPKFHLKLNVKDKESIHKIIDFAYFNNYAIKFRYSSKDFETYSIQFEKVQNTRSNIYTIIPTEEIEIEKTTLRTDELTNCHIQSHGIESTGKRYLISISPFARFFYINCAAKNYNYSKNILEAIAERNLDVTLKIIPETHDIVSIKATPAYEQTKNFLHKEYKVNRNVKECSVLTEKELQVVFDRILSYSCTNHSIKKIHPCIPFNYAEDGCFARAHAMRRIINEMGYECDKLFLYDDLNPKINGNCYNWGYHVAIVLKVKNDKHQIKEVIIDPSLYSLGPISETFWTDLCYSTDCPKSTLSQSTLRKDRVPGMDLLYYSDQNKNGYITDYDDYLITDYVCKYVSTENWEKELRYLVKAKVYNFPINKEKFQ